MKVKFIIPSLFAAFLLAAPTAEAKTVSVHGHVTKRGTYVQPHHRTSPGHNPYKNWSTKGNVNPYTGKKGTRDAYPSR